MNPSNFIGSNAALSAPEGVPADAVEPLFVYRGENAAGNPVVISCWKPSADELAEIQRTGRVWLHVLGHSMPPVVLEAANPFAATEEA